MPLRNTYWIYYKSEYHVPTTELILTNPNVPYIEQGAVLAIMNNHGSDSIIRVREIQVNELIARTTTALTALSLFKISADVGGEVLTPIKHDSSTLIPAQVILKKYPVSVTTVGAELRKITTISGLTFTGALTGLYGVRGQSNQAGGLALNHIYNSNDANTQAYILREGEGLAIKTGLAAPINFPLELTVHFSNGTDTFLINEIINVNSATEFFSMMNGSGSGVVLYVSRIELRPIRSWQRICTIMCYWRYSRWS